MIPIIFSAASSWEVAVKRGLPGPHKNRITMLYIQPGEPTQNAYVERFNRTARHERLDMHLFHSVAHAQLLATQWLWSYHNERPKTAIGGVHPDGCWRQLRLYAKPPVKMGGLHCQALASFDDRFRKGVVKLSLAPPVQGP